MHVVSVRRFCGGRRLAAVAAAVALRAIASDAPPVVAENLRADLETLAERGLVKDPESLTRRLLQKPTCEPALASECLIGLAGAFQTATNASAALDVLVRRGITGAPDYWAKALAPGHACGSANLAALIARVAARLPLRPPRPLAAAPLEATPVSRLSTDYDVVVAGAGTGGCGAAIQAARMGCSVLLLEETDWVGGQMCAAAVTSMDEGVTLVRERGLYRELCGQIAAHYQPLGLTYETAYWFRHVCVEPHVGRRILLSFLADAKGKGRLDLVLRARVTGVRKSGDAVTGVEIAGADGVRRSIGSRILVDATEYGDVIPLAGARYRVGNCLSDAVDPKRRVQDNTWCAVVRRYPAAVPPALLITRPPPGYTEAVHKSFVKSLVDGAGIHSVTNHPWNFETFIGYRGMPDSARPGDAPPVTRTHLNFNNDYPNTVGDIENPAQRQATLRDMRLKTLHLLYYIQNTLGKKDWAVAEDEGYDTPYNRAEIDAWLAERPDLAPYRPIFLQLPVMAYVRESRRIVGLHTLTAHEIERAPGKPVRFATCVALGDYGVDLHGSKRPSDMEPDLDRPADIPDERFGSRGIGPFAIPFECFIPERVDGFLPAEKNLSQSRLASGATRLQPHTLLMGQAVGAIAALSVRGRVQPRALDPALVQLALLDAGDTLFLAPVLDVRQSHPDWKAVQLTLTRGLLEPKDGCFKPQAAVTADELSRALARLSDGRTPPPALTLPLTRVDAARAFTRFLEARALKR